MFDQKGSVVDLGQNRSSESKTGTIAAPALGQTLWERCFSFGNL